MEVLTAKIAEFTREKAMQFKTTIKFNGKHLTVSLPTTLCHGKFQATYSNGLLLINRAQGNEEGTKAYISNTGHGYLQFGKKWVTGMPNAKWKADVEWDGDMFQTPVKNPVVPPKPVSVVTSKPVVIDPRAKAKECIEFLNQFSREHGFAYEVRDDLLTMMKIDRIS